MYATNYVYHFWHSIPGVSLRYRLLWTFGKHSINTASINNVFIFSQAFLLLNSCNFLSKLKKKYFTNMDSLLRIDFIWLLDTIALYHRVKTVNLKIYILPLTSVNNVMKLALNAFCFYSKIPYLPFHIMLFHFWTLSSDEVTYFFKLSLFVIVWSFKLTS